MDYSAANLLKAVIDPIFTTVKHTLGVLMTHVYHVIYGKANEYYEAYGLSQAYTPAT